MEEKLRKIMLNCEEKYAILSDPGKLTFDFIALFKVCDLAQSMHYYITMNNATHTSTAKKIMIAITMCLCLIKVAPGGHRAINNPSQPTRQGESK